MKRLFTFVLPLLLATSCAVVPKETVVLSEYIGKDLQALHSSHRNMAQLYYDKIKTSINEFIDDVYSPYIIHFVLEAELKEYKAGKPSIYGSIEGAGTKGGKVETEKALKDMTDFCEAATNQINLKREELLSPILKQEQDLLNTIDDSYQHTMHANATLTAYLSSVRKIKDTQDKSLSVVGLDSLNDKTTEKLVELSSCMDELLRISKQIDVKGAQAQKKIEDIISKFKSRIK